MCLGIPGKIIEIYKTQGTRMCKVDFGGVIQEACLETVPEANPNDYAIVHAGFVLSLLSEEEALETLSMFDEIAKLGETQAEGNEEVN